jgi:hypothetical protein
MYIAETVAELIASIDDPEEKARIIKDSERGVYETQGKCYPAFIGQTHTERLISGYRRVTR